MEKNEKTRLHRAVECQFYSYSYNEESLTQVRDTKTLILIQIREVGNVV